MTNLVNLKSDILQFQKQIIKDLNEFVVGNSKFIDQDNWHPSNKSVELFKQGNKLVISSQNKSKSYISFLEKNNSFTVLPQNIIRTLAEETIEIEVKSKFFGNVNAYLMVVEYNNFEKLHTHMIEFNKLSTITFSTETRKIRLAIRISGEGFLTIDKLIMKRSDEKKDKVFINKPVKTQMPKELKDYKIACIFDEFSMTCFREQVQLITFTPENWEEVLSENPPDALIVESAWRGNFGAWEHKIAKYNNQDQSALHALLHWCQDRDIPTSFWNKEDPIHFEKFIHTAQLFDHIFTTDENMIPKYREVAKKETVYTLPFSAEPKLHNPIKLNKERINKISFAGSYYANRHEERRKDMDDMLDIAAEFGLDIYDRNYERNKGARTTFSFPERFDKNVVGTLRYDEIDKAYKGYKVMLNVNSVKWSPTMFSRRVFEGLASGTPILSSYSEGVKKIFKDIVMISENNEELRNNLKEIFGSETLYRSKSLEGIREVYLHHTYEHRLTFMLSKFGYSVINNPKEVTVISIIKSKADLDKVIGYFHSQTWNNKKLVLFLDLFEGYIDILNQYNNENIKSFVLSYMEHYERINQIVDTNFISFFDTNNFYGENFLMDFMIATEYSQADVVGKSNYYYVKNEKLQENEEDNEYMYVNNLQRNAALINIRIFNGEKLSDILQDFYKNDNLISYFKKGYRLFSSDKFNFIQNYDKQTNENILVNDIEI